MEKIQGKSDIVVWLNHMAKVLWNAILSWILIYLIMVLWQFVIDITDIIKSIMSIITLIIIWIFIYRTWKIINEQYVYEKPEKVAITSVLSFFILNSLYILAIIFVWSIVSSSPSIISDPLSNIETFLKVTWFNNIYTIIIYVVFYTAYYLLAIRWLKVN